VTTEYCRKLGFLEKPTDLKTLRNTLIKVGKDRQLETHNKKILFQEMRAEDEKDCRRLTLTPFCHATIPHSP
jgi:hypothetical protein